MSVERTSTLFEALRDSGLLDQKQLQELSRLPEAQNPEPRVLGRVLVQRGLCTKFQITLLAQGKAKELLVGPYRLLDRLLVTPHIGFVTEETYKIFYRDTVENIIAWLNGTPVRVSVPPSA